eukprot:CAMPEP_0201486284 /NCGR_PEP_ID=MMETSP0151_2-20130828/10355_1 /ASSEMBLY_ACC=CAM_ASM_000257 /TAXON_ID=200890 /ORGANISM="Paramoeba atlantica, Strain 621/1 / CCAP 1560/9" /LENGTH=215 /DNA_ID=CAMNT_0047870843 /DNA_START=48 /DNA_END=695 /DNA_ORIENTATION=-
MITPQEDINELQRLISDAQRPNVRAALQNLLTSMTTAKGADLPSSSPIAVATTDTVKVKLPVKELTQYSWDQTDKSVKVYFTLSGIQDTEGVVNPQLVASGNRAEFTAEVRGTPCRLLLYPLEKSVKADACSYRIKHGGAVVLTLPKSDSGHWTELKEKVSRFPSVGKSKTDDDANPGDSIMKLMKDMYNDGDDSMKQMIAKAWTEGQEKRGGAM